MDLSKKDLAVTTIALKHLKFGAESFNRWRVSQRNRRIQLTHQKFDGWKLDGVNFLGVKLTSSSFRNASLRNSSFLAANVNNVDFTEADLTNADFKSARMHGAILDRAKAEGATFYGSIREGWSIKGIDCKVCRISTDGKGEHYDLFKPGEFESIYGGARIRIAFSKGFEPIDLLALPFYAKEILDKFPNKKLVFAGLSALGAPALEFRVEEAKVAVSSVDEIQEHFENRFSDLRHSVRQLVDIQLAKGGNQLGDLFSTLKYLAETNKLLVETRNEPKQITYIEKMSQFYQKQGFQAENISGNQITQINLEDAAQMKQLAVQLEKLRNVVNGIPTASEQDKQALAEATAAAKNNDSNGVVNALKKSGKWLVEFSTGVGVELVAAVLSKAMGIDTK